ncbi:MAG: VTT domain-containing protein, partial [Actinobacteria bacterium]|nr:VTT domain-containing protein [Actinomycetota bacterium]
WGSFTVVAARFAPIARTFAPFVAGIGSMNYKRFITYNICGAIAWVFTFILAGYFFGNLPVVKRNFHIVIFGVIYLLILLAAQLSLGYATNVGVRHAAIPTTLGAYPSAGEVATEAIQATPFFSASSCTPSLNNAGAVNQPVTLTMDCSFPNPAGGAANGLKNVFYGGGDDLPTTVELSATAQSRKE